jgi:RimJ/RimL family protein N-acetyltransferase
MNANWQPTLEGDLVLLRPTRAGDWAEMFAAASDPLIWAGHPAKDRYTEPRFREYFEGALASGGALTILDKTDGCIVGCSRYHDHDAERRRVEIGYSFLVRACWGGRVNGEVKRLMLTHAFRFVDTVQFAIAERNMRSRRACEKIGGTLASQGEERLTNGRTVPYCIYEIHRPDDRILRAAE